MFSSMVSAYGGGGGTSPCKKPKFNKFTPPASAVVSPQSQFSFVASADTRKKSIEVTVKKEKVNVQISDYKNGKYLVTGKFPESLKGTHAKIKINALGAAKCQGSGGWLIKIAEQ